MIYLKVYLLLRSFVAQHRCTSKVTVSLNLKIFVITTNLQKWTLCFETHLLCFMAFSMLFTVFVLINCTDDCKCCFLLVKRSFTSTYVLFPDRLQQDSGETLHFHLQKGKENNTTLKIFPGGLLLYFLPFLVCMVYFS